MIKWQNPPFSNYFSLFLAGIHNIHVFILSPKGCDVISSEIFLKFIPSSSIRYRNFWQSFKKKSWGDICKPKKWEPRGLSSKGAKI
jgi:hypothetical protein